MENEEIVNDLKTVFSRRLQLLRKMRGLSLVQLAKRMSEIESESGLYKAVSSTALEKYENAVMLPQSSAILCALSKALDVPVDDLMRPFCVDVNCKNFQFRKKSRLGKKKQEEIVFAIHNRIEKYIEIERILNIGRDFDVNLDDIIVNSESAACEAAMRLREKWSLGLGPIPQPVQVLENHGVKVIAVHEDPNLFDGTSNTIEGMPIVVINMENRYTDNPDVERRRFTLFHELGHQVLNIPEHLEQKDKEHFCDVFANEMLIPSVTFRSLFGDKRRSILVGELKNVQKEYGISARALMMKAKQLGIINESTHRWFCIRVNQNEDLKAFLDHNEMQETPTTRYEQLVYRALAMELITTSKAAGLMGMGVDELRNDLNFA